MTGLGTLRQLNFDHPYLIGGGALFEFLRVKRADGIATTKVAAADFPGQIAPPLPVVARDRTFAGVVAEVAAFGTFIQGQNCVGRKCAEAHRGNIEDTCRIGFRAVRAADGDAEIMIVDIGWRNGVIHPFVLRLVNIQLRAEGALVRFPLGALVDDRALRTRERQFFAVSLYEVLPNFRTYVFKKIAEVRQYWIVATNRLPVLGVVEQTDQREQNKHE